MLVRLSLIVVGVPEALSRRSAAATMFEIRVVAVILTTLAAALTVVVALTIWNVLEAVRSGPLCDWSVVLNLEFSDCSWVFNGFSNNLFSPPVCEVVCKTPPIGDLGSVCCHMMFCFSLCIVILNVTSHMKSNSDGV